MALAGGPIPPCACSTVVANSVQCMDAKLSASTCCDKLLLTQGLLSHLQLCLWGS